MSDLAKWGILGTGNIAGKFAKALAESEVCGLTAVGSRSLEPAQRFAADYEGAQAYGSYQEVLEDPAVEMVYISLPNHLHGEWIVKCAEAGKHILCEKPLTLNAQEGERALAKVREAGVFLMEAFMYRCHPRTRMWRGMIADGAIGEPRMALSNFGFQMGDKPDNIRQQNFMGGGGILDVGCYTTSVVRLAAGAAGGGWCADPVNLNGAGRIGETSRVDEWAAACLEFDGGMLANVTCAIQLNMGTTVRVYGTEGWIDVPGPFGGGRETHFLIQTDGEKEPRRIDVTATASCMTLQAEHVAECVREGRVEAPCMSWDDTLGNMRTLDAWRASIGLRFDGEED